MPAIIGAVILAATYQSFRLTPLVYVLILIHCIILMVGGHYTYAEVPLFDYLSELFGSSRNNYDKVGHFAQGFVPALIVREIILRKHTFLSQECVRERVEYGFKSSGKKSPGFSRWCRSWQGQCN